MIEDKINKLAHGLNRKLCLIPFILFIALLSTGCKGFCLAGLDMGCVWKNTFIKAEGNIKQIVLKIESAGINASLNDEDFGVDDYSGYYFRVDEKKVHDALIHEVMENGLKYGVFKEALILSNGDCFANGVGGQEVCEHEDVWTHGYKMKVKHYAVKFKYTFSVSNDQIKNVVVEKVRFEEIKNQPVKIE